MGDLGFFKNQPTSQYLNTDIVSVVKFKEVVGEAVVVGEARKKVR